MQHTQLDVGSVGAGANLDFTIPDVATHVQLLDPNPASNNVTFFDGAGGTVWGAATVSLFRTPQPIPRTARTMRISNASGATVLYGIGWTVLR
jgi:hypothetical protein